MRVVECYELAKELTCLQIPLFYHSVVAGFPSPASDYVEKKLDINELIIKNPDYTFFVRVRGQSMNKAGLLDDDILVVDKSVLPAEGRLVVVYVNGENTVKRIHYVGDRVHLVPESEQSEFKTLIIDPFNDTFEIFGVVIASMRKY